MGEWGRGRGRCTIAFAVLVTLATAGLEGRDGRASAAARSPQLVFKDTVARRAPGSLWGEVACQVTTRVRAKTGGSDPLPQATGQGQHNDRYRRLKVLDGDDVYGERCELGENDRYGPTTLYREGQHRITYLSLRLPDRYPLGSERWQTVMQMKQTQPSANGGGAPIIELQARHRRWMLLNSWDVLWTARARKSVWTRLAFDVVYSRNPAIGSIKAYADLTGDHDFRDRGESSRRFHTRTLKTETTGGWVGDGIEPGESIPSHLRLGLYHDAAIACPPPRGCAVHVDNVQVLKP